MIFVLAIIGGRLTVLNYSDWLIGLIVSVPIFLMIFFLFILPIFNQLTNNTFFGQGKEAARILKNGESATATVLYIGENSEGGALTINDQPVLNLKLLIEDGTRKRYEVSLDTLISRTAVAQFQPGAVFKVKIDSHDPQKVVIDNNE